MKKADVIHHFGSIRAVATKLNLTFQTVWGWGEIIPIGRAYQIQAITNNELTVKQSDYQKKRI